jgi:hypothetical protein
LSAAVGPPVLGRVDHRTRRITDVNGHTHCNSQRV